MEEYKISNLKRYATTHEHVKFVTQPSKIVGIESFRRRSSCVASSGERILDIGGGAGIWTNILREEGIQADTFAVDISCSMLKERPQSDIGVVGDIEHLPFEDGSFERVFFFASLHHVQNTQKALKEACRVIRTGGHIVLHEPISLRLLLLGKDIGPVDETQFCFSVHYLLRLLQQLGLQIRYTYYQGLFRRMLPGRQRLTLYRICDRLDEIVNVIPVLRKLGMLGSKLMCVAQKV